MELQEISVQSSTRPQFRIQPSAFQPVEIIQTSLMLDTEFKLPFKPKERKEWTKQEREVASLASIPDDMDSFISMVKSCIFSCSIVLF